MQSKGNKVQALHDVETVNAPYTELSAASLSAPSDEFMATLIDSLSEM